MRFKSKTQDGYTIYAVSGVHTVSFGIDAPRTRTKGLLGFAVERHDKQENEQYYMYGFKVFREVVPNPGPSLTVSTHDHPVQALVWDDFTAKPGYEYDYFFHPVKGDPKNLDRLPPLKITVRTEPAFDPHSEHDVFFNRGVASSQAYVRKFHNRKPSQMEGEERDEALDWLGRGLDQAILRFIRQAEKGDALRACFYEFSYLPVAKELKAAIKRGVDVQIIFDAKENAAEEEDCFPRAENLATIQAAEIPKKNVIRREANESNIQHNKFIVFLKRGKTPTAVWTGSTNISEGGIFGQTNVGHWVRNADLAKKYFAYWTLLSGDPGMQPGDDAATRRADNREFKAKVVKIEGDLASAETDEIPQGLTPIFSPRATAGMLNIYAEMLVAADLGCITLAFGVNEAFKDLLVEQEPSDKIFFLLLEKKDQENPRSSKPFVELTARNNVYEAWGAYIDDPVYQWAQETNPRIMEINHHVAYVHTKFLLHNPLDDDPVLVTGSANFSAASTTANDENMLVIRGAQRPTDIYFTEFMRIFNHYYFRAMHELDAAKSGPAAAPEGLFLDPDDRWLAKYKPGSLRAKRVAIFTNMKGTQTL
jgi:phosphatidylserine/phosphatidylglycerophosphate/cardiolipin synthase-like enzyme